MAPVEKPLVAITGPTASGKTGLAIELAEKYGGEIICADSRTIYRGMDIGTAKPSSEERERVSHHLLDVVNPGEPYSVKDFQTQAYACIDAIRSRGNIPFLVGGTGLYIDSVVLGYEWPEHSLGQDVRESLNTKNVAELQLMIKEQQLVMPANYRNKRHLVNTLMRGNNVGNSRTSPQENTYVVAITTEKDDLEQRIRFRAEAMFKQGVIAEAKRLALQFGWENEAMSSNIYPLIRQVTNGDISEQEAIERFVIKDRQLAKRQLTWLRRHDYVQWRSLDAARTYIEQILTG